MLYAIAILAAFGDRHAQSDSRRIMGHIRFKAVVG